MQLPDRSIAVIDGDHRVPGVSVEGAVSRLAVQFRDHTGEMLPDVVVMVVPNGAGPAVKEHLLRAAGPPPEDDFEVRADPRLGR